MKGWYVISKGGKAFGPYERDDAVSYAKAIKHHAFDCIKIDVEEGQGV